MNEEVLCNKDRVFNVSHTSEHKAWYGVKDSRCGGISASMKKGYTKAKPTRSKLMGSCIQYDIGKSRELFRRQDRSAASTAIQRKGEGDGTKDIRIQKMKVRFIQMVMYMTTYGGTYRNACPVWR